ncbi:hypothetical protein NW759_016520 [Fusarium solani]|nr:hypothetical protein NW759_016520 [Fusarium solani]
MALLYPRSKTLQSCLSEYFLLVVRVCHDLLKSSKKSMLGQLMSFLSEIDVRAYQSDFDSWANAIKEEVNLLMAQELQQQSRLLKGLSRSSESQSHRKKLEKYLRILDLCSTYDYQTTWKEIRRRGNTTLFTLVRKLGSGKSVSMANMVDDLNLGLRDSLPVAYFFCRYDAPESLRARTILGCLVRQLLYTIREPTTILEDSTTAGPPVLDLEGIMSLLKRTLKPADRAYFVLDGLDECDEGQRQDVLLRLREIQDVFSLRICLSFRHEAGNASTLRPEHFERPSTISIPEGNPDIAEFIQTELERCVESGKLRLGDPTLILEIRETLQEKSQGMFLWAALQIDSLCFAKTDESIRKTLVDLPRDLQGTFSSVLQQLEALGKNDQRRILKLVAAACRPLTTDELREALGVVPGDANWNRARMPNDIFAALACCGSLVIVDEETLSVKLIHHSVKQFLLSGSDGAAGQTFTIEGANKTMADVILTYLDYDVLENQLSTMVVPQVRIGAIPSTIIRYSLDPSSVVQKVALRLLKTRERASKNLSQVLAESKFFDAQPTGQFYFLLYVRLYWSQHILRQLEQHPAIYRSLGRALDRSLIEVDARDDCGRTPLLRAAEAGHEAVVRLLLEKGAAIESKDDEGRSPLSLAAERGHDSIIRLLLEKGAPMGSKDNRGRSPVLWAAEGGHEAVVRLLLEKGAAIESKDDQGRSPLSWAAEAGYDAVVRLLLEKGATLESKDDEDRSPADFSTRSTD